jgi:opacity protein-like surface antigen
MQRKLLTKAAPFVVAVVVGVVPAHAQSDKRDTEAAKTPGVEVTPFISLGSPFSSRVGAAIAFAWTEKTSVEAEIGYRRGEINALSSSVNLLYDLPQLGRVTPYLAAGLGLEQYGTALELGDGRLATQPAVALTVNAGGGIKVPVDNTWGLRTDARWSNGIGRGAPEKWRIYNGVTLGAGR